MPRGWCLPNLLAFAAVVGFGVPSAQADDWPGTGEIVASLSRKPAREGRLDDGSRVPPGTLAEVGRGIAIRDDPSILHQGPDTATATLAQGEGDQSIHATWLGTSNAFWNHGGMLLLGGSLFVLGALVGALAHYRYTEKPNRRRTTKHQQHVATEWEFPWANSVPERWDNARIQELLEDARSLANAQKIARLGSWVLDMRTNDLTWSKQVFEIFGVPEKDRALTYKQFMSMVYPDDREEVDRAYWQALHAKRPYDIEHRIIRQSDGEVRWVAELCEHQRDAEGNVIRSDGIVQDITEHKRLVEALRRSNDDLRQFAHVASHDLREPLRTISSFLQILEKKYTFNLDDEGREYIRFAVDGAKRMDHIIRDLLFYSSIKMDTVQNDVVNTENVLKKLLQDIEGHSGNRNASITHDKLPNVMGDSVQIYQLFQNIISNSIKYSKENVDPVIHISSSNQDGETIFSISDNGIGIKKEYFEKIFIIFQRLHSREHSVGTGIGLAICKKIVEHHGGRIWVDSVPGQGSTFFFTLPRSL